MVIFQFAMLVYQRVNTVFHFWSHVGQSRLSPSWTYHDQLRKRICAGASIHFSRCICLLALLIFHALYQKRKNHEDIMKYSRNIHVLFMFYPNSSNLLILHPQFFTPEIRQPETRRRWTDLDLQLFHLHLV